MLATWRVLSLLILTTAFREFSWLILGHITDKEEIVNWSKLSPALKPMHFNYTTHTLNLNHIKSSNFDLMA